MLTPARFFHMRIIAVRRLHHFAEILLVSSSNGWSNIHHPRLYGSQREPASPPEVPQTQATPAAKDRQLAKRAQQEYQKSYLAEVLEGKAPAEPKTMRAKVKKEAESYFYLVVTITAVGAFFLLCYMAMKETFGLNTPTGVYNKSLDLVRKDPRCVELFGERPLGHGETSGRGRRRHVQSKDTMIDGQRLRQVIFHLKGNDRVGKVYAEVIKKELDAPWEYRLLAVITTDTAVPKKIVIIDQR